MPMVDIYDVFRKRKQWQTRLMRQEEGDYEQESPQKITAPSIPDRESRTVCSKPNSANLWDVGALQRHGWEATYRSRVDSKTTKSVKNSHTTQEGWILGVLWVNMQYTLVIGRESLPSSCLLLCCLCEFCFSFPTCRNFVDLLHVMILPPLPGGNVSTWNFLTSKEPSKRMECFNYEETAAPHKNKMKKGLVWDWWIVEDCPEYRIYFWCFH